MDVEEAKPLVEEFIRSYLKENECVYPSDVADALGLEYSLVRRVFAVLEKEEKICKQCE
jgi:predicted ArsR family transcriptional regulator